MVLGVGTEDTEQAIFTFAAQMQLTYPALYDASSLVFDLYRQTTRFGSSTFPQDVLVDAEGVVVFQDHAYDPATWVYAVEQALEAAKE